MKLCNTPSLLNYVHYKNTLSMMSNKLKKEKSYQDHLSVNALISFIIKQNLLSLKHIHIYRCNKYISENKHCSCALISGVFLWEIKPQAQFTCILVSKYHIRSFGGKKNP